MEIVPMLFALLLALFYILIIIILSLLPILIIIAIPILLIGLVVKWVISDGYDRNHKGGDDGDV